MNKISPSLLVILAAVLWGIIGIFTRNLNSLGFNVFEIGFIRSSFTFIEIVISIFILNKSWFRIKIRDLIWFLLIGVVSITFFNLCYFYTIEKSTLSIAAVLLYTAPFFVIIMSALFLKQKITFKIILALIISLIGCVLTTGLIGSNITFKPIAFISGILSGLFYGLYSIFGSIILKKYSTPTLIIYAFLFSTLALLPFIKPVLFINQLKNSEVIINCFCISIFSTLLPYYFYSMGLSQMPAAKASILAFVEPLTATIVGIILFGEKLTLLNGLGIFLIFLATVMLNLKTHSKE